MGTLKVGTAGYKYDDWVGQVYPPNLKEREFLTYLAKFVDCVEINASFYTVLSPYTYKAMVQKTPLNFEFIVKAHKAFTHEHEQIGEVLIKFKESIQPLLESQKLGCVLVQFPQRFHNTPQNREHLVKVIEILGDYTLVAEFRHKSWAKDDAFDFLRELGVGFVCVDEPNLPGLMPPVVVATSPIGYVRFHGRNAEKWHQHEHSWERYDYLYSEDELREWLPKIRQLVQQTHKTYAIFNNHWQGKGFINAQMLRQLFSEGE
ncbi:MAG: DUF72 domain-containing protein [Armatimonadetes bacterium]|nr:DUF72 domain-containing protein [Armatimonadota bacterium]MDW8029041.1 DUF72 domain-containing protein [Armatimonadota bacterium]